MRQWLQTESEADAAESSHDERDSAKHNRDSPLERQKRKTEPTVLVLSGATASLLPSDFFRIAPRLAGSQQPTPSDGETARSSHLPVDGWVARSGGLYKVVQDRDPATLAPRGRYFLYFGSAPAALAYAQEVRDLHTLARRAVQPPQRGKASARRRHRRQLEEQGSGGSGSGSNGGGTGALSRDTYLISATATEEEAAALRNFTLLSPTARLDLAMQMPADQSSRRGSHARGGGGGDASSLALYDEEALDDVAAASATTKVLVAFQETSTSGDDDGMSTVRSDHDADMDSFGVTTIDGVRRLIAEDGQRRNLPWAVSEGLNGVVPVRWLVAEQRRLLQEAVAATSKNTRSYRGGGHAAPVPPPVPPTALWASRVPDLAGRTEQMNESARFSRFVVAFADAVEARRFVRSWHRRTVIVPGGRKRTGLAEVAAVVDATVLW